MSARSRVALLPLGALLLTLPAAPARGQATTDSSASTTPAFAHARAVGPTMEALTVAAHRPSTPVDMREVAFQRRNAGLGQAQAMMIVGGAAILVGAIIGDDPGTVLMVGGAVVGLYGLYKYLQ